MTIRAKNSFILEIRLNHGPIYLVKHPLLWRHGLDFENQRSKAPAGRHQAVQFQSIIRIYYGIHKICLYVIKQILTCLDSLVTSLTSL